MITIDVRLIVKQLVSSNDRWQTFLSEGGLTIDQDEDVVENLVRITEEDGHTENRM